MNGETKRCIDNARNVLVGKVPDPKSQVEQITLALTYRFMDNIDRQAEGWGGEARFFTNGYEKYAWARLMDQRLGGLERRELYVDAIEGMSQNPHLPQLFRDIFKDAYLPYRDAETLRLFLKEIEGFPLDHTEDLGDAYEYLLSKMLSQGDAGQFRTPRHIIDFIVKAVDPKKDDTILDPACGTAGFLIYTYQHILEANRNEKPGDQLSPDERAALIEHFMGYDISPDMVRLSLVNLYLHGFQQPNIHEYDTLTSEERWDENYDVIMANPPFMTPKGGIRPHKRFAVHANRSEVLFVDYIMEHLNPMGRAGVIVPEGIIFQSSNAYKALRKMLVEDNYLYAVVSLPAGVFQPYASVKTSILLMDRELARRTDDVLFLQVQSDGFDLGAQRREIDRNDLPAALETIGNYRQAVLNRHSEQSEESAFQTTDVARVVPKAKIAASGNYNLSVERYRETITLKRQRWPMVELGEVCDYIRGLVYDKHDEASVPTANVVLRANNVDCRTNRLDLSDLRYLQQNKTYDTAKKIRPGDVLICAASGSMSHLGKAALFDGEMDCFFGGFMAVARARPAVIPNYLYRQLTSDHYGTFVGSLTGGANINNLKGSDLLAFRIPLPPLEVQQQIVDEIEGYQKVIDGARQVIAAWKPAIPMDPDWPMVELGDVIQAKPKNGYSGKPVDRVTPLKVLTLTATTAGTLDLRQFKYLDESIPLESPCRCQKGDIYLQRGNTAELVGTAAMFDVDEPNFIYPDLMIRVRADESKILSPYMLLALQSQPVREYLKRNAVGSAGSMPKINQTIVEHIPISVPPLETQRLISQQIEEERRAVEANKKLIEMMDSRIKAKMAEVWGEMETLGKTVSGG